VAVGTGSPDLSQLPSINTSSPQFLTAAQIAAIDIVNKAIGPSGRFVEPIGGVTITRATNATTVGDLSVSNTGVRFPYVEGGKWASCEWGGTIHTIFCEALLPTATSHLFDYDRDTGEFTNARALSMGEDQRFSWSNNPLTPRIAFIVNPSTGVLSRYDTETMSYANIGHFPKTFTGLGPNLKWMHADFTDRYFVFLDESASRVVWWDSQDDTVLSRVFSGLDEPHMELNGRYIAAITGPRAVCWDTVSDTVSDVGTVATFYHAGHMKGGWVSNYSNSLDTKDYWYTPKASGQPFNPESDIAGGWASVYNHWTSWVQDATGDQQYAACFAFNHGFTGTGTGANHGGTLNCVYPGELAHGGIIYRRMDGGDNRYLCCTFTEYIDAYYAAMGGLSPDGKIAVFGSNMGDNAGRSDIFVANVPLGA
jgi:hypothetical protein